MKKISVTMEITKRFYREFEIPDEDYNAMVNDMFLPYGIGLDEYEQMRDDTLWEDDYGFDYCVTDEVGRTIIDWC